MEKEITVKIKVFDDPEYCENKHGGCDYMETYESSRLNDYDSVCNLFLDEYGGKAGLNVNKKIMLWYKCEACKKAFQESN